MIKGKEHTEPMILKGHVWAPYKLVNTATYVNSELVWHRNILINLGLKIKRLFKKPNLKKYSEKTINPKFYGEVKIGELKKNDL